MDDFQKLAQGIELTEDNRLMLGEVAMVLMPRWFFVGIMKRVVAEAGEEVAAKVYSGAGWEGAYNWAKVQIAAGLTGREVMDQYLGSMTARGWGRFEIVELDLDKGYGKFQWHNSALALELGETGREVCLWGPGAMAGGMQAILEHNGSSLQVSGREESCRSAGAEYCEIIVEAE